jgi:hypothetical protein
MLIIANPRIVSCISARRLNGSTIKVPKELRTANNQDNLSLPQNEVVTGKFLINWLAKTQGDEKDEALDMAMMSRVLITM